MNSTPSGSHIPGTQLPKQVIKGHKMSVAGLEAPGWLPCPGGDLEFIFCTSLWLMAASLMPLPDGVAASTSWPGAGVRAEELPALGQDAGAAEWAL